MLFFYLFFSFFLNVFSLFGGWDGMMREIQTLELYRGFSPLGSFCMYLPYLWS